MKLVFEFVKCMAGRGPIRPENNHSTSFFVRFNIFNSKSTAGESIYIFKVNNNLFNIWGR